MKSIVHYSGLTLLGAVLISFMATSGARAAVIQRWDFNDANGTTLKNTANSVAGGSSWDTDIAASTNGSGAFVLGNTNYTTTAIKSYALLNGATGVSTGQIVLDLAVNSWALSTQKPQYTFNIVNGAAESIAGIIIDVGTAAAFVGSISDTGVDNPGASDLQLSRTLNTATLFRLTINFGTQTYNLKYSQGAEFIAIGTEQTIYDPALATPPDLNATEVQLTAKFNATGAPANLDYIAISTVPEPSSLGLLGMSLIALAIRRRNRLHAA